MYRMYKEWFYYNEGKCTSKRCETEDYETFEKASEDLKMFYNDAVSAVGREGCLLNGSFIITSKDIMIQYGILSV